MIVKELTLKNFKGFKEINLEFNPDVNVIIGNNAAGKTSLLEGLCVAVGSFLLGIDVDLETRRHIYKEEIRRVSFGRNVELQVPVEVKCKGEIAGHVLEWSRELLGEEKRTTISNASSIKQFAENMQERVRAGESVDLPLILYFSTARLHLQAFDTKKRAYKRGSRLQGYTNVFEGQSNYKFFAKWFENEEHDYWLNREESLELRVVKNCVRECIDYCKEIFYDTKQTAIAVRRQDEQVLPLNLLSEGIRVMTAMIADIAFRCCILNPHLGENAARETQGVVLIDEVDLHLHPSWQKRVMQDLKRTFPKIQFIVTTHAPMILSSVEGRIIAFGEQNRVTYLTKSYGRDVNDILNQYMGTSEREESVDRELDEYFRLIESGEGRSEKAIRIREDLEKKFGSDYPELAKADVLISFHS